MNATIQRPRASARRVRAQTKIRNMLTNSLVEERTCCTESYEAHERFTRLLIQHKPNLLWCILMELPNRTDTRDGTRNQGNLPSGERSATYGFTPSH